MSTDSPIVADYEITDETMEAIVTHDEEPNNVIGRVFNLAERKSKLIPVVQIAAPKKDQWSAFNKKAAQELADSVKVKGLIYPILLRPIEKSPMQVTSNGPAYEVVAGRQRLYACHNILKWDEIPAVVMPMDDSDAEMFTLIENCARKTLKPDQLYASVAAWRKLHASKVGAPDPMDLRKGRKDAAAKARAAKKKNRDESEAGPSETAPEATQEPTGGVDLPGPSGARLENFQEAIAHATGTSVSTAKRTIKVASMLDGLTEEERSLVFPDDDTKHPTKEQLEEMTGLSAKGLKDTIKLVASGMDWTVAIPLGSKKPGRRPSPDKPASIDDLSDDEWLEATCETRMSHLKKKSNFKSDALLYRKFVKLRKKIYDEAEKMLVETKKAGHRGPFHLMLERVFRVNFPNEWMICGMCGGTGKAKINGDTGDMPSCNVCQGCGYKVTVQSL